MPQTPSQEQVSALIEEARRSASAVQLKDGGPNASAFDLRQTKQMSESETRHISALQGSFARQISDSLGSYLRIAVDMKLASIEQKAFSAFAKALQDPLYLAALRFPSLSTYALMQIDMSLVFQMLDLMLGGNGKQQIEGRDLTEIEDEIFESAVRILCDELKSAWRPALETDVRFDRRINVGQLALLMTASEKLLLTTFEMSLGENQGKLTLALPAAVSTALTRDLGTEPLRSEPANSQANRARLREVLLNCSFDTELTLPPTAVSMREIFALKPGSIVVLNLRATEPIYLNVAGKKMFLALPVGCGSQRGAQIEKVLSIAPDGEKLK